MGFGHRVYKHYDPRAKIMQKTCHEVLNEIGAKDDPLLDVALELEQVALHDDYFIEKALSQHRLLFRDHTQGDGFSHHDVHRSVRGCPHRRLDFAVEGNDRGSAAKDRASTPALRGCHAARLRADLAPGRQSLASSLFRLKSSPPLSPRKRAPRPLAARSRFRGSNRSFHRAPGLGEHDVGGPQGRRARSHLHDGIEPSERLDLAPALRRVAEQRQKRRGEIFRGAILLKQLGTTFSPSRRLVRMIDGIRFRIPRPTAMYSIADTL